MNDKEFKQIDGRFKEVGKRFVQIDRRFDETNEKIDRNHEEVMGVLDNVMVMVSRLDQERIFTFEIVKKIQKDIERQDKELQKVKKILKIV